MPAPATTPAGAAHAAFTTQAAPSSINELLGVQKPVEASLPGPLPSAFAPPAPAPTAVPSLLEAPRAPSASISADAPKIKEAIARFDKGQMTEALTIRDTLKDRAAITLFDWLTIRAASRQVGFAMIAGFLNENPDWPARKLIRKRAEEALYLEDLDAGTIRGFIGTEKPESALGKLALARISAKKDAASLVKEVWRQDDLSPDTEKKVLDEFGALLNETDHAARADHFFYHNETAAAQRNAARAGSAYAPIAKARVAVIGKAKNADALLDAVPAKSRNQPGYQYAKIQRLLAQDKDKEAANVMLSVSRDPDVVVDTKEWWERRRWLARDILDLGDAKTAYRIAAGHANVERVDVADAEFHAGWIALRFLNDPQTARQHFMRVVQAGATPITASRGNYWMGRTEEAAGSRNEAQRYFQAAGQYGTTYYGQLARAKLGISAEPIQPLRPSSAAREAFERNSAVRAIRLLYAAGAQDRVIPLIAETAEGLRDAESLALLAELTDKQGDPRSLLIVGKAGVSNGFPLEAASWPLNGVPKFKPVGSSVEPAVVHAIARQESAFHAAAVSKAGARGLLQMLPETAKRTASKVGVPFDKNKLTTDPAFNATLGAAHLGELVDNYDGSYILTFAAYNAGPGRARDWVARYGDPRNPNIDPVDWVERIPFTETRNYVQRVMENVQVYRARMNGGQAPRTIDADLRRGRG
ncbi:lytic transglycosylase [Terrihabitans soli]|uniref:Lytic transglycosylase n=2 Tax=Terrihabitans soli TaxID=708113 RepID=A0A6S6QT80_9HYPH|nr:lytic transglycosylase [Terrihabitans soli]